MKTQQIKDKIKLEHEEFKNKEISKSPEEVYKDFYDIHFYEECYELFSCDFVYDHFDDDELDTLISMGNIIATLYSDYLSCDLIISYAWEEELIPFIKDSILKYDASRRRYN